jgi:hypothetical protein
MTILGSRVWEGYPSNLALTTLLCEIPCMNQLNNTGEADSANRLTEFRPDRGNRDKDCYHHQNLGSTGVRTIRIHPAGPSNSLRVWILHSPRVRNAIYLTLRAFDPS